MRITLVGPVHPFKGGIAQHTAALAHAMSRRGHDVVVESWNRQYPARLYPGQLTLDRPEFPLHTPTRRVLSWNRPDTWWRVGRAARGSDALVVAHVSPVHAIPYRTLLAAGSGVRRRVVVAHNVLPHERSPLDRTMVRKLFRVADVVLTHNDAEGVRARGVTGTPVAVAPIAPFLPPGFRKSRPRAGVHRRLLFFGLVRPYKGLDVALRALAAGPPDVHLRVAGEFWSGGNEIRQLIDDLGLRDRVELIARYVDAEEVPALFVDVDALVLPYRTATGSQAVWTGFQFGVPVIASDAGALARDVMDGVDGLVVPSDDVDALAGAFRRFYGPDVAQRMRSAVHPVDPEPYWDAYLDALLTSAPTG